MVTHIPGTKGMWRVGGKEGKDPPTHPTTSHFSCKKQDEGVEMSHFRCTPQARHPPDWRFTTGKRHTHIIDTSL